MSELLWNLLLLRTYCAQPCTSPSIILNASRLHRCRHGETPYRYIALECINTYIHTYIYIYIYICTYVCIYWYAKVQQPTSKPHIEPQSSAKATNYCSKQCVKPKYSNLRLKHYWTLNANAKHLAQFKITKRVLEIAWMRDATLFGERRQSHPPPGSSHWVPACRIHNEELTLRSKCDDYSVRTFTIGAVQSWWFQHWWNVGTCERLLNDGILLVATGGSVRSAVTTQVM